jgi:hypothetical protein
MGLYGLTSAPFGGDFIVFRHSESSIGETKPPEADGAICMSI